MKDEYLAILGLGSNVGERESWLRQAVTCLQEIAGLSDVRVSSLYESVALLPPDAPADWDKPYYNVVISGNTLYSPRQLLEIVQKIETMLGREEDHRYWSPRIIDIDILAYGSEIVNEDDLVIPHRFLGQRVFTLLPLLEILPVWRFPIGSEMAGKTASQAYDELPILDKQNINKIENLW